MCERPRKTEEFKWKKPSPAKYHLQLNMKEDVGSEQSVTGEQEKHSRQG